MIKRKTFIAFMLLFLIVTSSIITWANFQNENSQDNDPQKDVIESVDNEDKNNDGKNNTPDTHNKEDEEKEKNKDKKENNSNINKENDEKKDEENQGKDDKNQENATSQDNQTIAPLNPTDTDNTKKNDQIDNTTNNILNTENIFKDFHIEGNKLVKYNGNQEYVSVPDGIEIIGEKAFKDNPYIKELILPDSVKCAESEAFANMQNLVTIEKSSEFYTHYDNIYDGSNITYYNVRSNGQ